MSGLPSAVGDRVRSAARAGAYRTIGVVFGLTGLGFLTVALWIVVAVHEGALMAYIVIGALYAALSLCFLILASAQGASDAHNDAPSPEEPPATPPKEPLAQIAEGFALGMQAGRAARDKRE